MPTGSNPLSSSQYYLSLIGDLHNIWQSFTGRGVTVAVYDNGVEANHPDLAANYDLSLELGIVDGTPNSASSGHGTAVAGIIGAADNSLGGVGVAYECTLVGVDFLGDAFSLSFSEYYSVIEAMNQFDVVNCSWGAFPSFNAYNDIGDSSSQAAAERSAIETAVETGRNGLGTIMTKAAGNYANDPALYDLGIYGNAQGDGLNNLHEFIIVGATDMQGSAADYSNWGVNLLIAAPSANVTTDMSGPAGYSNGDYTSGFSGTSAATPVVSGVTALMLEANPGLHWRDVQEILALSASHTGSTFGHAADGFEAGAWFANGADNWNGGGLTYHLNYGYGMTDAGSAVRMAEIWTRMRPDTGAHEITKEVTSQAGETATITDFGDASLSVTITEASMKIDHVYLNVDFSHSWSQDLTITLIAPDGSEYLLFDHDSLNPDQDWTFGISALQGMTDEGTWTLRVSDDAAGDEGTLDAFSLRFEGTFIGDNDIYTFTDDFLELVAEDSSRSQIEDTNGGEDWINLAAVNGNIHLSMRGTTSYLKVEAADWADLHGGIENVTGGNGNDTISGSATDNVILGSYGNDILFGNEGADTLDGGFGNDSLSGDGGDDSLSGQDGDDTLSGSIGHDRIFGGAGHDLIYAGADNDFVQSGIGDDSALGGDGMDSITGDIGMDTLRGEAGNDVLNGGNNSDQLYGGSGDDRLTGESGYDHMYGGDGRDQLFGGTENDWLYGDDGADLIRGGTSEDRIYGGRGHDELFGEGGFDRLEAGSGDDYLSGGRQADNLFGGAGNDLAYGGDGLDRLFGGDGDDVLWGGTTGDGLFGGRDQDTLYGEEGADRFFGGQGNDLLFGGSGDDTIYGSAGFDTLEGGTGNDILMGNFNADTFVFRPGFGQDTITDFDAGNALEKIDLSAITAITDYEDLYNNHLTVLSEGTLISDGSGNSVLLAGVTLDALDSSDFLI